MIIPADASIGVQNAIRDLDERLRKAKSLLDEPKVSPDVLAMAMQQLRKEISLATRPSQTLDAHEFDKIHRIPAFQATHTIDQSIANNTPTAVAFDTDVSLNPGMHSATVNNSRATVYQPGYYLFTAHIVWANTSGAGRRLTLLQKNGDGNLRLAGAENAIVATATSQNIIGIDHMVQDDYVEVIVFQSSGGALAVIGATTAALTPIFSGFFIGR